MPNADAPLVAAPVRAEDYVPQALMEQPGADVVDSKAIQRTDPLYDIFVDPDAAPLPNATALVPKGQ